MKFNIIILNVGLQPNKTWQLFPVDSPLYNLWKWVDQNLVDNKSMSLYSKNSSITSKEELFNAPSTERLLGVRSTLMPLNTQLSFTQLSSRSEAVLNNSEPGNNSTNALIHTLYKSNDRYANNVVNQEDIKLVNKIILFVYLE